MPIPEGLHILYDKPNQNRELEESHEISWKIQKIKSNL